MSTETTAEPRQHPTVFIVWMCRCVEHTGERPQFLQGLPGSGGTLVDCDFVWLGAQHRDQSAQSEQYERGSGQ